MIPSVLAQHVERGVKDFLRTTFPITTPHFENVLDQLLETPGNVFKGPYLDIQLPFQQGTGGTNFFPDFPTEFPPYLHQEKAFQRLAGDAPKSTIVATGTGSGKTESFLYPILDYCYRHRNEPGIKALLIYPMNALASDQAGRLARLIHTTKAQGHVTAGIYVGQHDREPSMTMHPDKLISDKGTIRLSPPDILLTNYKMLDYLLLRQEDKQLWELNDTGTLRFLVVDELHTFDGAQGADLGCLVRRLKSRLKTEPDYLCCVGTSATLGDGDGQDELLEYARAVFGETFTDESVISEARISAGEFLEDALISVSEVVPVEQSARLDPGNYDNHADYIRSQYSLWLGEQLEDDFESSGWRIALGTKLKGHLFFHNLIRILKGKICSFEQLIRQFAKLNRRFSEGGKEYQVLLLNSLLALISEARCIVLSYKEDRSTRENVLPFLNVRLQLWLRELRRMTCEVSEKPTLRFADDLHDEQLHNHLPLAHCRECGSTGWIGLKKLHAKEVTGDLKSLYQAFFKYDPKVVYLFPESAEVRKQALREGMCWFCPKCLHVSSQSRTDGCSNCSHEELILVYMPDTRVQRGSKQVSLNDCPYCNSSNSLTLLGSRAASLTSVMIVQLFSSTYNDDKKLITFSDNVQDAAHRAGFFNGRTYRFNLRAALQQFILDGGDGLALSEVPKGFIDYWKQRLDVYKYVSTFLAPNMEWFQDYDTLRQTGELPKESRLVEDVDRRVAWEVFCEYGYQARVGRTLEKTGSSVSYLDPERLRRASGQLLDILQNEFGALHELTLDVLNRFLLGLLVHLKNQGAIVQPALESFIADYGNTYLLNRQTWLPNFGRNSRAPKFLTTRRGTRFESLYSASPARNTWCGNWADKSFGALTTLVAGGETVARDVYKPVLDILVEWKILEVIESKAEKIWGVRPTAFRVSSRVQQYRCDECGHNISVAQEEQKYFDGALCQRFQCYGQYMRQENRLDYYGKLYATGDVARIFAREHTGLLERGDREQLEDDFKKEGEKRAPWHPNLLSCTPTLEMGIDIGSLSSLVLCSVPPGQANYLQRIGRAGRRDGNALNLTVANGRPHDLYFFSEPEEMLAGRVDSPGIFLDASAVLERQFTAFCFDRWVASTDKAIVPKKLGKVLTNLAKVDNTRFPHNFIHFVETAQVDLFHTFIGLFTGDAKLSEESINRLRAFVDGDSAGEKGVRYSIMEGLHSRNLEKESLRKKVRTLTGKIKRKKTGPKDKNYAQELQDLEIEKAALQSLVRHISERDTFNFFTDEGLLPNYAFPEVGVMLRSLIYRRKTKVQDGESSYETWNYDYERPASAAIQELAPANTFYAGGRRVRIDQVDMAVSDVETWRFCDNCSHKELIGVEDERETCIVCGSTMWSDSGQKQLMLKMRQVFASTADRNSRISDDSDDRDPVFFNKQMLLEFDDTQILDAYKVDGDFPFGFDFLSKVEFCEVNFGEISDAGTRSTIAGRESVRKGFSLCRVCGKVQDDPKKPIHDFSCTARDKVTDRNLIDCIYLYRQFTSEAIRILLPVSIIEESERKLQSLIAAIQFGLKLKFRGKIDHLQSTVHEEPLPESTLKRKYLVLYDTVPGGTGYLKQLMRSEEQLMEVLQAAQEALRSCSCVQDPEKDGCYRCLFVYRNSYNMPQTSRDTAIELLSEILDHRDRLVRTSNLRDINFNAFLESELEARFIGALKLYLDKDLKGSFKNDLIGGKPGYYFSFGEMAYYVEPQVELGMADGVSIPSRADFVIRPARMEAGSRQVALFLDGFSYHRNRVGADMAQRMAIAQSGKYLVWSLSWYDVENKFEEKKSYCEEYVDVQSTPMASKYEELLQGYGIDSFKGIEKLNSFDLLFAWLQNPQLEDWRTFVFTLGSLHYDHAKYSKVEAVASWKKDVNDVLPELFSDQMFGNTEPCLYGHRSYGTWADGVYTQLFMSVEQGALKPPIRARGLNLGCILNDHDEVREEAQFRPHWNGFLRLYNFFQFLPCAYFVTYKGVADHAYDGLKLQSAADTVGGQGTSEDIPDDDWAEVKDLTDDALHALLDILRDKGLTVPVIGFELEGDDGEILAEAEMAWEDTRLALLEDEQLDQKEAFGALGWRVYGLVEVQDNQETFINAYFENRNNI